MKVGQLLFTNFITFSCTDPFSECIFIAKVVHGVDFHGNVVPGVRLQATDRYSNGWEHSSAIGQGRHGKFISCLIKINGI